MTSDSFNITYNLLTDKLCARANSIWHYINQWSITNKVTKMMKEDDDQWPDIPDDVGITKTCASFRRIYTV